MLFCEIGGMSPTRAPTATLNGDVKGGLPIEAFSAVQELFNGVEAKPDPLSRPSLGHPPAAHLSSSSTRKDNPR